MDNYDRPPLSLANVVGFSVTSQFFILILFSFLTNVPQAVAKSDPRDVVDVSCAVGSMFFFLVVSVLFLLLKFLLGALYH